ncbi:hypothetical protein PSTT_04030 [Puccinia striiformis]|uniref:Uncharacterized protein n=1 Tax=Puccinia striiformis TaxID=27350 RepID=A0A2S4VU51_9BASI|nr:hypothetical protein PSTT_04030 [Puccinia striiformis]
MYFGASRLKQVQQGRYHAVALYLSSPNLSGSLLSADTPIMIASQYFLVGLGAAEITAGALGTKLEGPSEAIPAMQGGRTTDDLRGDYIILPQMFFENHWLLIADLNNYAQSVDCETRLWTRNKRKSEFFMGISLAETSKNPCVFFVALKDYKQLGPKPRQVISGFLEIQANKVILLKDSLDVLNPSKRELQEQLNWLEKQRIGMYTDQLPMIRKILKETSDGITHVAYHRLMELGNAPIYDGLPVEMREMVTQHYSMSVFEGTKKLFTDYKTPFKDEGLIDEKLIVFHPKSSQKRTFQRIARFNVFVVSEYAFKSYFQDENTLREFVVYVARKHANEAIPSFYQHMHYLTEHWFWKYMDKFTSGISNFSSNMLSVLVESCTTLTIVLCLFHGKTALGIKEKLYINFVYLVEIVKSGDKGFYNSVSIQSDLESFDQSFVCEKYFSKFTSEHSETDHSKFPAVKNNQKETTLSWSVEEEMTKIINCLITENPYLRLDRRIGPYQLFDLVVGIVNLFQFMEKELFPGIIDELLKNKQIVHHMCTLIEVPIYHEKPRKYFDLISLFSRIHLCNETVLNSSAGSRHQNEVIHQDTTEKMNDLTTQYKARYREVLSSEHVSSLRHEFQMLSDKT